MRLITCVLLVILIHKVRSQCLIDHSNDNNWEKKLHKYLFSQQNGDPPSCGNVTIVKMNIIISFFSFKSDENLFSMQSLMSLQWTDNRLKWTPSDYDGIKDTIFWRYSLWRPEVLIQEQDYASFTDMCTLVSSGKHLCIRKETDYAFCNAKLSNWPYDVQDCVINYRLDYKYKHVKLVSGQKHTMVLDLVTSGHDFEDDWIIVKYGHTTNSVTDTVDVKVSIQRNTAGLVALLVFPSVVVTSLTILCLLLDARNMRLWLCWFTIICHFLTLNMISREIPKHSEDTPTILLFYRSSLVMACMLTLLTLILKSLRNKSSVPPLWVTALQDLVMSRIENYLYFRWKTDYSDDESTNMDVWNKFAYALNGVCLCIYVFVYTILLMVYIPIKTTVEKST